MGGEEIVTAESFGNRIVTYVRAAGTTIATHSSVISWMHKDLNMNSMRSTREDGTLIEQEGGSDLGKHELDPAGNSVGFADPYTVSYPDPFPYFFQPFESFVSLVNGQFQSYSVDGIQVPRSYFSDQIDLAFGGIFGLVEHQMRKSIPRKVGEIWRSVETPSQSDGPDGTIKVGNIDHYKFADVYAVSTNWALSVSLSTWADLNQDLNRDFQTLRKGLVEITAPALQNKGDDPAMQEADDAKETCFRNVLEPLKSIGFGLNDFLDYLGKGADFYDGTTSSKLAEAVFKENAIGYPFNGVTVAQFWAHNTYPNKNRVWNALTSYTLSATRFTVFLDPSPGRARSSIGLVFHEALHAFHAYKNNGKLFGDDKRLLKLFFGSTSGNSEDIEKYIDKNCSAFFSRF